MKDTKFKMYDRVDYCGEECSFVEYRTLISGTYGCLVERQRGGWSRLEQSDQPVPEKYKNVFGDKFWNVPIGEISLIRRHNQPHPSINLILKRCP